MLRDSIADLDSVHCTYKCIFIYLTG